MNAELGSKQHEAPTILIIEPSSAGPALISTARRMNLSPVVLTHGQGARTVPARYLSDAHRVAIVDTNEASEVIAASRRLAAEMHVVAVLPGFEYYVPIAARAAAALGLPGLDPAVADAFRFKDRMRAGLQRSGLAAPAHHRVESVAEAERVVPRDGFPYVVKPVDASGSLNVTRVDDPRALEAALRRIFEHEIDDMDWRFSRAALVEEYVPGPELSVEGYVRGDRITFVSLTEKLLGPEPGFVEMGHIVNAAVDPATAAQVEDYVARSIRALGLPFGPFHAELRLSPRGPMLMEIAARLAGDRICDLILRATGVDLYEEMIRAYAGLPEAPPPATARGAAGIRYLSASGAGRLTAITGVEMLERLDGFVQLDLLVEPGREIRDVSTVFDRVACAIFAADRYETVKRSMDAAARLVRFCGRAA